MRARRPGGVVLPVCRRPPRAGPCARGGRRHRASGARQGGQEEAPGEARDHQRLRHRDWSVRYLQDLIYKLSKFRQAIDKDDLPAASNVLGPSTDAQWVQNINAAFSKCSSSPEDRSTVDSFNASLASLFTSVNKLDAGSSKSAFVSSATALEKWIALAGLSGQLKGF
uniref:Maintenance of Photosystem II under High light 2 C-terminal domain-containing protein n=1 Tax=Setaria viridis TaxID=4556 RepID=A0A4U6TJS9_SETVI|nr:hypothetical protein SEVIR_8G214401v2 [Setaria viridis]